MGGGMVGGMAQGFATTMMAQQKRKQEEEYKKAVIDHMKAQTKAAEAKLNLEQYSGNILAEAARKEGIPVPPMPAVQIPQPTTPQPQARGILGRIFGGGQPEQAPAQVQPVSAPAQQPFPQQVAQAQMQSQIGQGGGFGRGVLSDIFMKKYFDLDTKQREQGNVARSGTIMTSEGPMFTLFDRTGKPIQQYPAVPEYGTIPMTGAGGETGTIFYPKASPPPGFIQTGPANIDVTTKMSEKEKDEWRANQETLGVISDLRKFNDPKIFGTVAAFKHQIYQDPKDIKAAGVRTIYEAFGGKPDPNLAAFQAGLESFNSAVRKQLYAGNLTENEAAMFRRQAAEAVSPEQFQAVLTALEQRTKRKQSILESTVKTAPGQFIGTKPSLDIGVKTWVENGRKFRINPKTGKKEQWVD